MALRVGAQHRIDAKLAAQAGAAQRWADVEKSSPSALFEQLAAAHSDGKQLWGLNVEPLGTYAEGRSRLFKRCRNPNKSSGLALSLAPYEQSTMIFVKKQEALSKPDAT